MITGIHNLFVSECSDWDHAGDFDIQLYNVVLRQNIGKFKAGTKVDTFILWLMDVDVPCVELYFNTDVGQTFYKYPIDFTFLFGEPEIVHQ